MPCCCLNILNLCKFPVCGTLVIAHAATSESGVDNIYTLVLDYFDTTITIVQEQTEGENIQFGISQLNENFEYTGQVFDSAGNVVEFGGSGEVYDCIKFRTIIALSQVAGTPPVLAIEGTVVIEAVVDENVVVTGTSEAVTGIAGGSSTITSNAFIGVRVIIIRGNLPIPGIDPLDGSNYFTKVLASDFITLSTPLVPGEFIRIQTIPA